MYLVCFYAFLILHVQMNIWTSSRTLWPIFYNNRQAGHSYYPYRFGLYNRYFPNNFRQISIIAGRSYPWLNTGTLNNGPTKLGQYIESEEAYNPFQPNSGYPIYSNQWNAYNY